MAMVFWIAAFKYTYASVAAILSQTTAIISLILAALILKEPLTKRKLVAVVLAMIGITLVTFYQAG